MSGYVCSICQREYRGSSAHYAAEDGIFLALQCFIDHRGVSVHDRDKYGETPLHSAARNDDMAIIDFLLERGADPLAICKRGSIPLHCAAGAGHLEVTELLLSLPSKDQQVQARDRNGYSALHYAVSRQGPQLKVNVNLLHALISGGSDITAVSCEGQTPAQRAKEMGQIGIANDLEAYALALKEQQVLQKVAEVSSSVKEFPQATESVRGGGASRVLNQDVLSQFDVREEKQTKARANRARSL